MSKRRLLPLLLAIISLIMIIGGSYAVWNYNFIGNSNTISTADMSIEFLESNSNIINIENALPMGDNDGKSQETTFDFSVTSRTPKDAVFGYILSIEKLEIDNDATALNDNNIKVYLTDYSDNELVEPTLISELDNYKLYSNLHRHNNTNRDIQDKYKLRVWVNPENVNAFNWNSSTKYQYKFKINVSSSETTPLTVNTVVNGGTITGSTSKEVMSGGSVKFETSPNETYSETSVSCTNSQNGTIKNGKLVVANVTSDTTCTITYAPSKTVLYTDGTLIINEKASDRETNITTHGAVTNEYQAMSNSNAYVFSNSTSQPWNSKKTSVTSVEIGQKIQPTSTAYWFDSLPNMMTGDFTNLDTSKVTSMKEMFEYAGYDSSVTSFVLTGIDDWNTSQVTDMFEMFDHAGADATTWSIGDLSNWNVSNVITMGNMFYGAGYRATTFNIGNLSNWDTSKVTAMANMFNSAGFNSTTWSVGNLSNWNTSKVTNMYSMFSSAGRNASTFNLNLSNWDTSQVTTIDYMFQYAGYSATTFDIGNLSHWDTSKVTNMSSMFSKAGQNATTFDIGNLSNWDTSKVTNMSSMFSKAGQNATTWNNIGTLKVYATNIDAMFNSCPKAKATLNIYSNPTKYTSIFSGAATASGAQITVNYNCATVNIVNDIIATKSSNSNVVKGVNLEGTCPDRTISVTVNNGTVNTSSATVPNLGSATFTLTPDSGYSYPTVACTNNQIGSINNNVLTISNVFSDTTCTVTYSSSATVLYTDGTLVINESGSDSSANISTHGDVTNTYEPMSNSNAYVFSNNTSQPWNSKKTSITRVEIGQSIQPTDTKYWFYGLTNLSSGDFTNLDTSQVTSFYYMFYQAGYNSSVTSFTLTGLNNWNTSNVTSMYNMFYYAGRYATTWNIGELSSWNTSSTTTMYRMFYYAGYSATTLNSIGTLKVYATDIYQMFYYSRYMKATLNIYSNPSTYTGVFNTAANQTGALITVNYSSATTNIDNIIATKSSNSNVVKGIQLD